MDFFHEYFCYLSIIRIKLFLVIESLLFNSVPFKTLFEFELIQIEHSLPYVTVSGIKEIHLGSLQVEANN